MNLLMLESVIGFGWEGQVIAIPAGRETLAAGLIVAGLATYTDQPVSAVPVDPPFYLTEELLLAAVLQAIADSGGVGGGDAFDIDAAGRVEFA